MKTVGYFLPVLNLSHVHMKSKFCAVGSRSFHISAVLWTSFFGRHAWQRHIMSQAFRSHCELAEGFFTTMYHADTSMCFAEVWTSGVVLGRAAGAESLSDSPERGGGWVRGVQSIVFTFVRCGTVLFLYLLLFPSSRLCPNEH